MNIHRCIEFKFFDCSSKEEAISNNSIPVNVHTDFLFKLLKSVDVNFSNIAVGR